MKKYILSATLIASYGLFMFLQKEETPQVAVKIPDTQGGNTVTTPVSSGGKKYKDGTFAGDSISEYYGNIQVAAVIKDGKLTDVKLLQYPTDRQTSALINQDALPILKSEAITAQSANIDAVSGASETSPAFIKSLSSALSRASL